MSVDEEEERVPTEDEVMGLLSAKIASLNLGGDVAETEQFLCKMRDLLKGYVPEVSAEEPLLTIYTEFPNYFCEEAPPEVRKKRFRESHFELVAFEPTQLYVQGKKINPEFFQIRGAWRPLILKKKKDAQWIPWKGDTPAFRKMPRKYGLSVELALYELAFHDHGDADAPYYCFYAGGTSNLRGRLASAYAVHGSSQRGIINAGLKWGFSVYFRFLTFESTHQDNLFAYETSLLNRYDYASNDRKQRQRKGTRPLHVPRVPAI